MLRIRERCINDHFACGDDLFRLFLFTFGVLCLAYFSLFTVTLCLFHTPKQICIGAFWLANNNSMKTNVSLLVYFSLSQSIKYGSSIIYNFNLIKLAGNPTNIVKFQINTSFLCETKSQEEIFLVDNSKSKKVKTN